MGHGTPDDADAVSRLALASDQEIQARGYPLRIDLIWERKDGARFKVQRSANGKDNWKALENSTPSFHIFSDYIGAPNVTYYYRVKRGSGSWSPVVSATTLAYSDEALLDDLQETGIRYFVELGHPDSGMAREGAPGWDGIYATGATGMGLANLIVGVHRGYLERAEAVDQAYRVLEFLDTQAKPHFGAFVHWLDGDTGESILFDRENPKATHNGVDLVETSFLGQSFILLREYFDADNESEARLRALADKLWLAIDWQAFVQEVDGTPGLLWHYLNGVGHGSLMIRGWNECFITYLLAVASPAHGIGTEVYRSGWFHPTVGLGDTREVYGIRQDVEWDTSWPLFFAHYSFIGFDPHALGYKGRSYFDHIQDACLVQIVYAHNKSSRFKDYGELWGLTASADPDGYRAHAPGEEDNGTLTPTASLASMPYVPGFVMTNARRMYRDHGETLWGPFGFYDAFNPSQEWVSNNYIGIDVGPIAPMIENYRSGLLWKLFMNAPEIKAAVDSLQPFENKP